MHRFLKQLLYGFLYLVIFIGIPAGIYFAILKPAPTCWDNIQNGTEQGVDCGGGCPQVCIPKNLRPLEAAEVKVFPLGRDENSFMRESLFVEVTNPNVAYAARGVHYTIRAETGFSTSTRERLDGDTYFYGGEVRTLAFPNIIMGEREVVSASIEFSNLQWVPAAAWRRPALRVLHAETQREVSPNGGGTELAVEGEIINDDVISFPSVEVLAFFRGEFGEITGVSRTELSEVAPNGARAFRILHPDIREVDVGATSVVLSAQRP